MPPQRLQPPMPPSFSSRPPPAAPPSASANAERPSVGRSLRKAQARCGHLLEVNGYPSRVELRQRFPPSPLIRLPRAVFTNDLSTLDLIWYCLIRTDDELHGLNTNGFPHSVGNRKEGARVFSSVIRFTSGSKAAFCIVKTVYELRALVGGHHNFINPLPVSNGIAFFKVDTLLRSLPDTYWRRCDECGLFSLGAVVLVKGGGLAQGL